MYIQHTLTHSKYIYTSFTVLRIFVNCDINYITNEKLRKVLQGYIVFTFQNKGLGQKGLVQFRAGLRIVHILYKVCYTPVLFQAKINYFLLKIFGPGRFSAVTGFFIFSHQLSIGQIRLCKSKRLPCRVRCWPHRDQKYEKSQCENTKKPVTPPNRPGPNFPYILVFIRINLLVVQQLFILCLKNIAALLSKHGVVLVLL